MADDLPEDIYVGQPAHANLHNQTNDAVNDLDARVLELEGARELEGGVLRNYGDSWSQGIGLAGGTGNSFSGKAAQHYAMGYENLAVSGSTLASIGTLMLSDTAFRWDEGDADVLVLCAGINDSRYKELTTDANAGWLRSAEDSLRIACALAMGQERVDWTDAAHNFQGFWTNAPYAWGSEGSNIKSTQFPTSYDEINFDGDEITLIYGGYYTETNAVVEFTIDGEHVGTRRLDGVGALFPGSVALVEWRAERFAGLTKGPHTLRITKADLTTDHVYVDSYILPTDAPPIVVACKEPPLPAPEYSDPVWAPYTAGSQASTRAVGKVVDKVAAEFAGVRLCELTELIPVTDYQADKVHPDESGRDKLTADVVATVGAQSLEDRVVDLVGPVPAARPVQVTQFQLVLNQPYRIPDGAVGLRLRLAGGGGGGASGRRGAAGTVRCGGGAGSGGGYMDIFVPTTGLPKVLYVTAGNGGAGGAAIAVDDTNGNNGVHGVGSYVALTNAPALISDFLASVPGGLRGSGGTNASGTGGASQPSFSAATGAGGSAASGGGAGNTLPVAAPGGVGQGGGAGGGITSANSNSAGSNGLLGPLFISTLTPAQGGGAAGSGNGGTGEPAARVIGVLRAEGSGAGGAGRSASAAGAGGKGGRMSGGGGGGAALNGFASGAGGAGGDGFVEITAFF